MRAKSLFILCATAALSLVLCTTSFAANYTWTQTTSGENYWSVSGNWNGGVPSGDGNTATVVGVGGNTFTNIYDASAGSTVLKCVEVRTGGTTGSAVLKITGGTISTTGSSVQGFVLGSSTTSDAATLWITGGELNTTQVVIGYGARVLMEGGVWSNKTSSPLGAKRNYTFDINGGLFWQTGTFAFGGGNVDEINNFNIGGGTFYNPNGQLTIGNLGSSATGVKGTNVMTMTGGVMVRQGTSGDNFVIGALNAAASTVAADVVVSKVIMSGGVVTNAGGISVAQGQIGTKTGYALMDIKGGTFVQQSSFLGIGYNGAGHWGQNSTNLLYVGGGLLDVNGNIHVNADKANGLSRIVVTNGTLNVLDSIKIGSVSNGGSGGSTANANIGRGEMEVTGGLVTIANQLDVVGILTNNAGTKWEADLKVSGGSINVAKTLNIGGDGTTASFLGSGALTLSGGQITASNITGRAFGAVTFSGGTLKAQKIAYANAAAFAVGDGSGAAAKLVLQASVTNTFAGGLSIAGDGNLNLEGSYVNPILSNSLTMTSGAEIQFTLGTSETAGGVAGTDFDRLDVIGTATLNGTVIVDGLGAYTPVAGDSWIVLYAAGGVTDSGLALGSMPALGSGLFWSHTVNANDVTLTVVIPEPSVMALLGLGLAMTVVVIRRRRK